MSRRPGDGQALVEFTVALVPFLLLLLAIVDVGRGIYVYNGVSQAAREIARVTIVHPYAAGCSVDCELGTSAEAEGVIATQRGLVPGLAIDPAADIA
ncbi:MAG TPA: TadE family protein, partial [Candidatus Limnocylindrales bacterium]|nr:TadE family protein [Candidatus Limnocylindrales bacterium]